MTARLWTILLLVSVSASSLFATEPPDYLIRFRVFEQESTPWYRRPSEQREQMAMAVGAELDEPFNSHSGGEAPFGDGSSEDLQLEFGNRIEGTLTKTDKGLLRLKAALTIGSLQPQKDGTLSVVDERFQVLGAFKPGRPKKLRWGGEERDGKDWIRYVEVCVEPFDPAAIAPPPALVGGASQGR